MGMRHRGENRPVGRGVDRCAPGAALMGTLATSVTPGLEDAGRDDGLLHISSSLADLGSSNAFSTIGDSVNPGA